MTDNLHIPSNTNSTNASVVRTPPSSPRTTTFVDASAHDLFHPYSPGHLGSSTTLSGLTCSIQIWYVVLFAASGRCATRAHASITQFEQDPYSGNENPIQGNVAACNNVTAGYAPFDDIPIEEQQCEEEDEQVAEAFVSWYKAQVAVGSFDNATFINSVELPHASSSSVSSVCTSRIHIVLPLIMSYQVSNGHVNPADLQLVPASLGLTDVERVNLADALKNEIYGYLNLVLSAVSNAGPSESVIKPVNQPVAPISALPHIDNSDINTIPGLIAAGNDDDDAESVATSDDEDADTIEPEDVIRHYWVGPNIRYLYVLVLGMLRRFAYTYPFQLHA
jgi:hypothetical protein